MKLFNFKINPLRKYEKYLIEIEKHSSFISALSDDELNSEILKFNKSFKEKYKVLNDFISKEILYGFALTKEVFKREKNISLFDAQLIGGLVLHEGKLAEMKTGEGKTFVSVAPAYINSLCGKSVHIVTANDYLAKRDYDITKDVFSKLNISVGYISEDMSRDEKRKMYGKDVVYVSNSVLGFDYLKNNMVFEPKSKFFNEDFNYVIIDEVDYILIDEATTPLILSNPGKNVPIDISMLKNVSEFIKEFILSKDNFNYDYYNNVVTPTEKGVLFIEKHFGIENFSDIKHLELRHQIHQFLQAYLVIQKDNQYIVEDDRLVLIDSSTGRLSYSKTYCDGLHQAIEVKEGLEPTPQTEILGQICYPNFFKKYNKISGMSGTIATEKDEFKINYNMDVVVIPTNKPILRTDKKDLVFVGEDEKYNAILKDINESYLKSQPVLVSTRSVDESEFISEKLNELNISNIVLNAKNHLEEADIISKAGQRGAITVSTNMAGRGTDIKLEDGVCNLGGLKVVSTYKNNSRRIDNQLRGRSGRQGDVGESQFYISLDDELIKGFSTPALKESIANLSIAKTRDISSPFLLKQIEKVQIKKESLAFEIRKTNLRIDSIVDLQREIIYKDRNNIVFSDDIEKLIENLIYSVPSILIDEYVSDDKKCFTSNDIEGIKNRINDDWDYLFDIKNEVTTREELQDNILSIIKNNYYKCNYEKNEENDKLKKKLFLLTIDKFWSKHLLNLKSVELLVKFKDEPYNEYEFFAVKLFDTLIKDIKIGALIAYLNESKKI